MISLRMVFLVGVLSLGASAARACDGAQIIQLATNMIFAWQKADGSANGSCSIDADGSVGCVGMAAGIHPNHQWYVDNITGSYSHDYQKNLRGIYFEAQRNNEAANHLGSFCSLAEIKQAAAHAISCYEPVYAGSFIGYGSKPTWSEAAKAGLPICVNP
jgi:hypothetical protein